MPTSNKSTHNLHRGRKVKLLRRIQRLRKFWKEFTRYVMCIVKMHSQRARSKCSRSMMRILFSSEKNPNRASATWSNSPAHPFIFILGSCTCVVTGTKFMLYHLSTGWAVTKVEVDIHAGQWFVHCGSNCNKIWLFHFKQIALNLNYDFTKV